ncbi:Lsr2 family DNA-binding protein [Streptomyces wedmorensis]
MIRTWAREHGHQVANRGLPSKTVLEAYAAARPVAPAQKAG